MVTNEEILDFSVAVDIRDALREIQKFNKEMVSAMKAISKSSEGMGKTAEKAANKATKASKEHSKAIEGVTEAYDGETEAVHGLQATILDLQNRALRASGDQKRAILQEIEVIKKADKARKAGGAGGGGGSSRRNRQNSILGQASAKDFKEKMQKAGEILKAPLQSFLQKDAKGLAENVGALIGKGVQKGVGERLQKRMATLGGGLQAKGARRIRRGKAAGGIKGAGMQGMGKILGGLGKLISSIGPAISLLSTGVMSLIKLFIDAEAMVKDFNKGILESASTAGFLNSQVGSLGDTLDGVRDAAYDAKFNLDWGVTKEQHQAVLNVMTQEGVALDTLAQRADNTREGMAKLSQQIVSTGIAYSRALGVPISEIGQLQAEMMTEMGASVKQTEHAFAMMTREANDSGIAANKFFQMIKGVSQDLSVWNMRMEDSTKLLGKLGKVLSPRSAQKFFQEITSGFKNLGRDDLFKRSMFAGAPATKEANQGTLNRMNDELAKTLGRSAEEVSKMSRKDLQAAIQNSNLTRDQRNTAMEKLKDRTTVATSMKGDVYAQSQALRHVDTAGQMTIIKAAFENFGADIRNANAMDTSRVAEALGISMEMAENFAHMARTAEDQKAIMLDEAKAKGDEEAIASIMKMSEDDLINELGKNLPKSPEEVNKEIRDQAMKQGEMTMSIQDKLGVLVDWFMNTFYNLMMGIWDTIESLNPLGSSSRADLMKKAHKYGNVELEGIAGADNFTGKLASSDLNKQLAQTVRELAIANKGDTDAHKAVAGERRKQLQDFLSSFSASSIQKAANDARVGKVTSRGGHGSFKVQDNLSDEQLMGIVEKISWHSSKEEAIEGYGKFAQAADAKASEPKEPKEPPSPKIEMPEPKEPPSPKIEMPKPKEPPSPKIEMPKPKGSRQPALEDSLFKIKKGMTALNVPSAEQAGSLGLGSMAEQLGLSEEQLEHLALTATETELQSKEAKKQTRLAEKAPKEIKQGNLENLRQALYEFYLYKDEDKSLVAKALGGGNLNAGLDRLVGSTSKGHSAKTTLVHTGAENKGTSITPMGPNYRGGMVTGIANGMAVVAAQGEGLASVGKGERIVPAGGGGNNAVTLNVNGIGGRDLAALIEGKVVDGIREYKRREKLY